jgi:hypothetical protein
MLNWLTRKISIVWLKAVITVTAVAVIVLRIYYPDLRIDAITFGLMVVAILPWLSELIESAKFPGGWEVKFRDIREAGEKVTASSPAPAAEPAQAGFLAIAQHDSNLALVALRIEIEKRVRTLARLHNLDERRPLGQLLRELTQRELLPRDTVGGLQELVAAGNQAAHGARVQDGVAEWAVDVGPRILASLDEHLKA